MGFRAAGVLVLLGCFDPATPAPSPEPARAAPEPTRPGPDAQPPGADTPPVSGTRLRAVWLSAEDGSRERVAGRWFDTELDQECAFALASDGVLRCLPAAGAAVSAYYSDATCQPGVRLFLRLSAACARETDLGAEPSDTCPTTTRLFRTRAYTGGVWVLGTECVPSDRLEGFVYSERVSELAPSEFVGAEQEVE